MSKHPTEKKKLKLKDNPENRAFLSHLKKCSEEVESWSKHKKWTVLSSFGYANTDIIREEYKKWFDEEPPY